ncbi:M3 family metallopeptidase [Aureibacter tunicatorum]|uniref:Peptidyl-dipeptidase Dcp n=1 Tax=Aureibacter tunicatorum TaxID=866807 RepID=A0AAE3XU12_9BACT|nr:M3 family metallopeptidase [Aureibacter tunicatorum]MDR6241684.1 peptidyl-dipeptidase Dcp [Aureibacter tunicatorum]BDD07330.1 peptidase M3 [Aureibacter tunicatorum]
MSNPLLKKFDTPFGTVPFEQIRPDHFLPALKDSISEAKEEIEDLINDEELPSFENTIIRLEEIGKNVSLISSIFFNLNSAETNDEIQKIAQKFSPLITEYHNDILLEKRIFDKVKAVHDQKGQLELNQEEKTLLEKTYKAFVRNGALLDDQQKQRLREIDKELSNSSLKFGEHVLKATNSYELVIKDENDLKGLPEAVIEQAFETAHQKGKENCWIFTLDYPSYIPFVTYADNRSLREEITKAAGKKAFDSNNLNNEELVKKIVNLRLERANLLGYESHADFILEERMAKSADNVNEFLNELREKAMPAGIKDAEEVKNYASKLDGIGDLQRWDWAYYAEKLKKEKFNIDDEMLKPYFQLEKVLDGIFEVASKLYDIEFVKNSNIPVYHTDVTAYEVNNTQGEHIAVFYADFFPREGKRNGAWMTSYKGQYVKQDVEHRPHVSIVCNFTKPTNTKPSLLTFNEVTTLFHEFGHALHGMLAKGTFESLTGTSVFWDFVELPSQILENWAYEKECLDIFAKHFENDDDLPHELIEKIKETASFMEGYQTIRQLSFGLLDMKWHSITKPFEGSVAEFEDEALSPTQLMPKIEGTNMSCSFSHIFQGGYSAGYYSYKWAEVLDADAFEHFKERGIFDKETADKFKRHILEAGGKEHPMELYKKFRGKEPNPDALLKRAGLIK